MFSRLIKSWMFLPFFLIAITVFSQQQEFILGRLLDAQTQEPVVFATIRIKDRALGVISNVDGGFKIPMRFKEYGNIIEISSMGYRTKEVLIDELSENKINVLELDPGTLELSEAIVKARRNRNLSARKIVKKAIEAIPKNYPKTPFSTIGYYRDYQFKDDNYINLNEAILEVFDQGFDEYDQKTTEIRIFDYGLNKNFEQDSLSSSQYDYKTYRKVIDKAYLYGYGGNEFTILRIHDAIRNHDVASYDFMGTLKTDLLANHSFTKGEDTYLEGDVLYTIRCNTIRDGYRAQGTLYISKTNFAIHKLEYTLYDNRHQHKDKAKNKHGHKKKTIFEVVVDYARSRNNMYLNYISFHNSFEVRKPPKFVLDSALVNAPGGYWMLYFNKPVDSTSANKHKNYDIIYKQKKFGIKRIEVFKDSVKLHGDPDFIKSMRDSRGEINSLLNKRRSSEFQELFVIDVKNIRDVDGNLIHEPEIQDYQQFREFFVQRVKPDSRAPFDNLFMNKSKPIFENQPIAKPKDFKDYWMNTPLQKDIN